MKSALDEFITTIARLRAPDGCPWDREQTHRTLARYLLEEAYEVLEAIHEGDSAKLKEELGDLLLQVVLNAQVAQDAGDFDIQDIARSINEKIVSRHPHVFGEAKIDNAEQVKVQWEELKRKERKNSGDNVSAIDGVPPTMPALLQALKISEKAVDQGFEWNDIDEVWAKLHSELDELQEAIANSDGQPRDRDVDLEMGDVLFTLVNVARWQHLNPEESLLLAMDKFKQRFRKMEEITAKPLKELSKKELAKLWEKAKACV
ncbi:MAG: nucleoside triphosphate pyrophosphohydrolase [Candidatus Obscuribacterales bacterium]|nr:nucleoside triphosphate pyrophosphohydrolase [Candidatus Obscuribacterales bacterium]